MEVFHGADGILNTAKGEEISTGVFSIRPAVVDDADRVAMLVARLLGELYPELQDMYRLEKLAPVTKDLLGGADIFGFIAENAAGEAVGVIMLNQCKAIYALGRFGEISELYVDSRYRSCGLGAAFIQAATRLAQSKGWSMLEVGAPDVPRWQKTVDFYIRNGFHIVGPRLYLPLD